MKLKARYNLYKNLGKQLLGYEWMATSYITAMPISVIVIVLAFRLIDVQSKGYAVLSVIFLSIFVSILITLPFWGWLKYRQMKRECGDSEAHRCVRLIKKDKL